MNSSGLTLEVGNFIITGVLFFIYAHMAKSRLMKPLFNNVPNFWANWTDWLNKFSQVN